MAQEKNGKSNDVFGTRLTDLESDAFQLKLRNYYLEKRLNASLAEREHEDHRIEELLTTETPSQLRVSPQEHSRETLRPRSTESLNEARAQMKALETHITAKKDALRVKDAHIANLEKEKSEALLCLNECQSKMQSLENDKNEALRLLSLARDECQGLKDQLTQAQRNAEDVVAFEAEQIAELVEKNKELETQLSLTQEKVVHWQNLLSQQSLHPAEEEDDTLSQTSLMTRRARDIQSEIAHSFDFLSTTNTDRFSQYLNLGSRLANEATRAISPTNDQDSRQRAITLRRLLEQSRALVTSAEAPPDPHLADCLALALKLADPGSPPKIRQQQSPLDVSSLHDASHQHNNPLSSAADFRHQQQVPSST